MTEKTYELLHRILSDRVTHTSVAAGRCAYESALNMLEYAHKDDIVCLEQFDYWADEHELPDRTVDRINEALSEGDFIILSRD